MRLGIPQSRWGRFYVMLGADALALLVALYHQFTLRQVVTWDRLQTNEAPVRYLASSSARWAWGILALMVLATAAYLWLSRDEAGKDDAELIQGLPPESDELRDR